MNDFLVRVGFTKGFTELERIVVFSVARFAYV